MATKKYTVQHIGYPTSSIIPESAWKTYSTHATESAAWKSINKATAHLDYGSWDDHYRVIAPNGEIRNRDQFRADQPWDYEIKQMKRQR
jgi:hypothetical protein